MGLPSSILLRIPFPGSLLFRIGKCFRGEHTDPTSSCEIHDLRVLQADMLAIPNGYLIFPVERI